jgi:hypothetical protein
MTCGGNLYIPPPRWGRDWEGVNPVAARQRKHQTRLLPIILPRARELSANITPTLTRPHQGGGNALAICKHLRPFKGTG